MRNTGQLTPPQLVDGLPPESLTYLWLTHAPPDEPMDWLGACLRLRTLQIPREAHVTAVPEGVHVIHE
ncbi:hypothetical protein [Streptomyces buecherae]|uniref:hypothetical protein n=1 Tax=Streptomyces buecherae TaxID=2763006 RepID=UPI001C27E149|nr:hypothetical protein [Streptomyces buecherae]